MTKCMAFILIAGNVNQFSYNEKQSQHPIIEHSKRKGDRTTFWVTSKIEAKNIR